MERTHARPERPCGLTRRRRLAKLLLLAVLLLGVFRAGYIPSGFIYTQF